MKKTNNNRIVSRLTRKAVKNDYDKNDLDTLQELCTACNSYTNVINLLDEIEQMHRRLKDAFPGNFTLENMTNDFTEPIPMQCLGDYMGTQEYEDDVDSLISLTAELSKETLMFRRDWNKASRKAARCAVLTRGPGEE